MNKVHCEGIWADDNLPIKKTTKWNDQETFAKRLTIIQDVLKNGYNNTNYVSIDPTHNKSFFEKNLSLPARAYKVKFAGVTFAWLDGLLEYYVMKHNVEPSAPFKQFVADFFEYIHKKATKIPNKIETAQQVLNNTKDVPIEHVDNRNQGQLETILSKNPIS